MPRSGRSRRGCPAGPSVGGRADRRSTRRCRPRAAAPTASPPCLGTRSSPGCRPFTWSIAIARVSAITGTFRCAVGRPILQPDHSGDRAHVHDGASAPRHHPRDRVLATRGTDPAGVDREHLVPHVGCRGGDRGRPNRRRRCSPRRPDGHRNDRRYRSNIAMTAASSRTSTTRARALRTPRTPRRPARRRRGDRSAENHLRTPL